MDHRITFSNCKHELGITLIGDKISVIGRRLIFEVSVLRENGFYSANWMD